jgi:hypothetical protein
MDRSPLFLRGARCKQRVVDLLHGKTHADLLGFALHQCSHSCQHIAPPPPACAPTL